MFMFLFKFGLKIVYALGEKLQPVVEATICRIFGRELIEKLSGEADTVHPLLSLALALLHDVREMLKCLGMYRHLPRLVILWNDG